MSMEVPHREKRLYSTDSGSSEMSEHPPVQAAHMANTNLEYMSLLNIFTPTYVVRNTGIICTIGPACNTVDALKTMIEKGMCVARLNFSHGTHEYHAQTITNVREAVSKIPGKSVAIALDTKGPEIRTGLIKGSGTAEIQLSVGSVLKLSTDERHKDIGSEDCVYVDYVNLPSVVALGDLVYIDDGLLSCKVTEKGSNYVTTVVQNGGMLGSRKGVNLPGAVVDLPSLSDKDKQDLKFGVEQGVDSIFASFIRKASDIEDIRKELGPKGKHIFIIAKIENEEGVRNFDQILEVTDGVMVARGDLGIEIPAEKVFLAQKMMIGRCNRAGKPVFVATQMLESMVSKPRPTRAEASDVANAVLDGADCVMLSGETAKGKYPVETVGIMSRICLEAEAALYHKRLFNELRELTSKPTTTIQTTCIAAVDASYSQNAAAILTLTSTGKTAFVLAKYRPRCPIIAITRDANVARKCHLHRGIHPLLFCAPMDKDWANDIELRFAAGIEKGRKEGYVFGGSTIVVLSGWKPGPAHTNTIRVFQVE